MSAKKNFRYPQILASSSSVARVPVPRGKNIVVPPPTKAAEFEVKNRHKNAEEEKHLLLLLFCFKSN